MTSTPRPPVPTTTRRRLVVGGLLLATATALFLKAWLPVLTGDRVLIGGDILEQCCQPWVAEHFTLANNPLLGDVVVEVLPWQEVTTDALRHGRLPLWNPYALSGKPLLGSDLPGAFSPFNLLAVPLPPAQGLSLGMLLKLWVAGAGMAVFLRILGARAPATVIGGIAYATSSFMVVWLGWPHTGVAAILPWAFAAAEWCLSGERWRARGALALAVALQFMAGHAETSLHLAFGLAVYSVVRWLLGPRSWRTLAGLTAAAMVGAVAAAVQLLPFIEDMQQTSLAAHRASLGSAQLSPAALLTWLAPNVGGSPLYPGPVTMLGLDYNEWTGFATVAMLTLAPIGAMWAWRRRRPQGIALVVVGALAASVVYGPLTPLVGRLPLLSLAYSTRMIMLLCFVVPALGGLGVEALWSSARRAGRLAAIFRLSGIGGGVASLAGLAALTAGTHALTRLGGARVEEMWQPLHGYLTFWLVLGGLALASAIGFVLAGLAGGAGRTAVAGLGVLVLAEAWLFAAHYQPMVPATEVGPPTLLTSWLEAHAADDPIAAIGRAVMPPDSPTLYRLHDVRTYDAGQSLRARMFWSTADPGLDDEQGMATLLAEPRVSWLAAAGVKYVLTAQGHELPGTTPVFRADLVTVAEVPGHRPFAWAAPTWSAASGPQPALARLKADALGPPVLEGTAPRLSAPGAAPGRVVVLSREPGRLDLRVSATTQQAIIVQQSWGPGWNATVDGRPATVHPADLEFQGVVVPAGRHRLTLSYLPASVTTGLGLSCLGVVLIALLLLQVPGRVGRTLHMEIQRVREGLTVAPPGAGRHRGRRSQGDR